MAAKGKGSQQARPPQLNKFMHPRNPYKKCASFKQLAISYPEFRVHCTYDISGKVFLDFKNAKAVKTLTTCLLHKDFGLKVEIPDNRLVPTLPLRLNYLLWIEDLLSLVHPKTADHITPVLGIDIGTGGACIYPLLGCNKFGWNFVATETDDVNLEAAQKNVLANNFQDSIIIEKSFDMFDVLKQENVSEFAQRIKSQDTITEEPDSAPPQDLKNGDNNQLIIDFTMCNPPFFSSEAEMDSNQNSKKTTRSQPVSVATGSLHEKVTEGGEVAFVSRMIEMSLQYKEKIRIFSTLIGIKNNVKPLIRLIKEKTEGCFVRVVQTEFCQGRTMRWGVAWTFRPEISLEKISSAKQKLTEKPFVLHIPRTLMSSYSVQLIWSKIVSWLKDIKIKPQLFKSSKYFVGAVIKAYRPTWLHQRQKKRKKNLQMARLPNTAEIVNRDETSPQKSSEEIEKSPAAKKRKLDLVEVSDPTENDSIAETKNEKLLPEEDENVLEDEFQVTPNLEDESQVTLDSGTTPSTSDKNAKTACFLVCFLQLKQTEALISIEMKYRSGVGKKDAVHQLLQYLENRMKQVSNT